MAVLNQQSDVNGRAWERVLEAIREKIGSQQAFETWFKPIVPIEISPSSVELEVPNAFFVDWIHEHHLPLLRRSLEAVLGQSPDIHFAPRETDPGDALALEPRTATRVAPSPETPRAQRAWLESQLNPRLTFDTFVVGSSNRFTHAACLGVAANVANMYNPLFVFGGSGLGKTHLLHAIGHAVRAAQPDARVFYVPAERFTNEMIYAIQHGQTLAFRNKYRNVD